MRVGQFHTLPVWVIGDKGVLLGNRHRNVVLPLREAPDGLSKGDELKVFVTTDSDDVLTATLREPVACVGQLAMMPIIDATDHGVFADWGLAKDLFIPWKHQHTRLEVGDQVLVYVSLDNIDRPVGWTKLVDILTAPTDDIELGQQVSVVVYGRNDYGVLCAVDGKWSGLIYDHQLHGRYHTGDTTTAYVERIRDTDKLDLSLVPMGRAGIDHATAVVLLALEEGEGFLPLNDRSTPDAIRYRLGLSKKQFKKALGGLYRDRRITMESDGIRQTS